MYRKKKKPTVIGKIKINKQIAIIIEVIIIVVLVVATSLVVAAKKDTPKKQKIFSGISKISAAKLVDSDKNKVYSYYDSHGKKLLTPFNDNGIGTGTMCEVIVPFAECTDSKEESNKSNPLFSPLVRGTVDSVASVAGTAENPIYCLASGVKVNGEYLHIIEDGYLLPKNELTVSTCAQTDNGIKFTLDTVWAVPVNVTLNPQEYHVGYLERIYNVNEFTAEYMDICFAHTAELSGKLDFSQSDVIKKYEWIRTEAGGTLRLFFKKKGEFYGYSYSLDKNGRFEFTIKRNISADTSPVVMLDPGHGGSDPGAASLGEQYESALTLDISEKTAKILADNSIKVILTRRDDIDVSLDERITMARKYSPSLFVAIHCDSAETPELYGTHSFYYKNFSSALADNINKQTATVYSELYSNTEKQATSNRGIKFYPFAVTRIEECPSVLVECGYLTNPDDCNLLLSEEGRQKIAEAIAAGIINSLQ